MSVISTKNLIFTYAGAKAPALDGVSIDIEKGEFVLLFGRCGCGKTTLLRHFKPSTMPKGEGEGEFGTLENEKIGFVFQNPSDGFATEKVFSELAFKLENKNMAKDELRRRVAEAAAFFGLEKIFNSDIKSLSGGEKQLLCIACAASDFPEVLLLDEPLADLDPVMRDTVLSLLLRLNREKGMTVVLTGQQTEKTFGLCSRVVYLDGGKIVYDGEPESVQNVPAEFLPDFMNIFPITQKRPADIATARRVFNLLLDGRVPEKTKVAAEEPKNDVSLRLENVYFRYNKNGTDIFSGLDFYAKSGEITAVMGGSGCGKSTLLKIIAGSVRAGGGSVALLGKSIRSYSSFELHGKVVAYMPQEVESMFVKNEVFEDLFFTLSVLDLSVEEKAEKVRAVMDLVQLSQFAKTSPFELSGGERQRVALAKILLTNPDIILMDEPTKGLDGAYKDFFAKIFKKLCGDKKTVIIATSDMEFAAKYSDCCVLLFNREQAFRANTHSFIAQNDYFTSSASLVSRGIFENAITSAEVTALCVENGL